MTQKDGACIFKRYTLCTLEYLHDSPVSVKLDDTSHAFFIIIQPYPDHFLVAGVFHSVKDDQRSGYVAKPVVFNDHCLSPFPRYKLLF